MSDRQQYELLVDRMRGMMRGGCCAQPPEFGQTWAAIEAIKNKHGGYPPNPRKESNANSKENIVS